LDYQPFCSDGVGKRKSFSAYLLYCSVYVCAQHVMACEMLHYLIEVIASSANTNENGLL
jgi:hypothetical protein